MCVCYFKFSDHESSHSHFFGLFAFLIISIFSGSCRRVCEGERERMNRGEENTALTERNWMKDKANNGLKTITGCTKEEGE